MSIARNWLDRAAVALSALCLLHCLALPLVVASLPFLASYSEGHLHAQLLVVVLPVSILALGLGYRRHRNTRIVVAGMAGMTLLVTGASIAHVYWGLAADRAFTIAGALMLATAHFFNSMRSRLTGTSC